MSGNPDFRAGFRNAPEVDRTVMTDTIKRLRAVLRGCDSYASLYLEDRTHNAVHLLQELDAVIELGGEARRVLIEKHQFPRADEIVITRLKK
jgi:hypothetical protein